MKKTLLSWSSGKDSAWALQLLRQQADIEVVGLFTTVNKAFGRVAMHAVRIELLHLQAASVGLPVEIISLPYPCSNADYEMIMGGFVTRAKQQKIECIAFGDLFLEDIRQYRETKLADSGLTPIFPLWGMKTKTLARQMVANGLRAMITCVDPRQLATKFCGREFNADFLDSLPVGVDPCGEQGEFHSFVFDGPMFTEKIKIQSAATVNRDGFVFTDLKLAEPDDRIIPIL